MSLTVKERKYAILISIATLKTVKDHIKGMWVQPKKQILFILVYVVAPSFFFQNGVICLSIIATFCFRSTYVYRRYYEVQENGHFQHKTTYSEKTTSQIQPNLFIQVDIKVYKNMREFFKFSYLSIYGRLKFQIQRFLRFWTKCPSTYTVSLVTCSPVQQKSHMRSLGLPKLRSLI